MKSLKTQGIEEHKKLIASVTKEKELKTRIKELIRLTQQQSQDSWVNIIIDLPGIGRMGSTNWVRQSSMRRRGFAETSQSIILDQSGVKPHDIMDVEWFFVLLTHFLPCICKIYRGVYFNLVKNFEFRVYISINYLDHAFMYLFKHIWNI